MADDSRKYGPVAKLQWLHQVAGMAELSRAELAALVVLTDMANTTTGIAWPSYNTMAESIGTTPRGTKKAIQKLLQRRLVVVAEPGNRTRSNRYRIAIEALPGEPRDTTQPALLGSERADTTVVNAGSIGGELAGQKVVNAGSPESIHPSEHEAKDEMEGSQADGGAAALRPGGPTLARQPDEHGLRFPEFWAAVGKRATVHQAERAIAEYLAQGVALESIVDGANRWRQYNEATGGRRATSPVKWLENRKWLDDWTPPAKRQAAEPKAAKAKKAGTAKRIGGKTLSQWRTEITETVQRIRDRNKDWEKFYWDVALTQSEWEASTGYGVLAKRLRNHTNECPACSASVAEWDDDMEIYLIQNNMVYPTNCTKGLEIFGEFAEWHAISQLFDEAMDESKQSFPTGEPA